MYFQESEAIVGEHGDLQPLVERVDEQLSRMVTPAPLRPGDFACVLGADATQVAGVFELLAERDVLFVEEMVECESCQTLMPLGEYQKAVRDEDDFACTACGREVPDECEPISIYRMTPRTIRRNQESTKPRDVQIREAFDIRTEEEPLCERAQSTLMAMLKMGAIDADHLQPTAKIAERAFSNGCSPNSLKMLIAQLATRRLIKTKTGRGNGCWLTEAGRQRALRLSRR
jgi:ribosomal protein L34E